MDAIKLIVSLPATYLTLWETTKLLKIRFAAPKTTLKIALMLSGTAFVLDLVNIYVLVYAQWSNLVKLVPLLGSLILYYAFALILIWAMYRDTNKKSVMIWLIYAAVYFLIVRVYAMYVTGVMALVGGGYNLGYLIFYHESTGHGFDAIHPNVCMLKP